MQPADSPEAPSEPPLPSPTNEPSPASASAIDERHQFDQFRTALLKRTPHATVTFLLVLANIGVFLAMVAQGLSPMQPDPVMMIDWGANYAPRTLDGELWRLFTCMFLHFGAVHLGMNMLALWNLGQSIERLFGNVGFFLIYLLSGLAGSLASVIWNPGAVSAGASGAIFGVAGALLGGAWKLRRSMPRALLRSAWWLAANVLGLLAVFAVVNYFHSMIDNAAHVAGCAVGFVIGLVLAEPVPHPGRSRRTLKNAIVAVAGTLLLVFAVAKFAQPTVDVVALHDQYLRLESQTNRDLDSAQDRIIARAMTPEEYAEFLEHDILPRWEELHQDFTEPGRVPEEYEDLLADLIQIIELRQASWKKEAEALREHDPRKQEESDELLDEAEEIIRRLNEENDAA